MTLALTPGAHPLRRGPSQLQVGLDAAQRVLLPPGPTVQLDRADARTALLGAGLALADAQQLRAVVPPPGRASGWQRHTLAALVRRSGPQAARRSRARSAHVIGVSTWGHPLGRALAADLLELCRRSGLVLAGTRRPGPRGAAAAPPQPLRVLVGVGEPDRARLDPWVEQRVPHLLVRLSEGRAVLGPFVAPGRTPCLRCLDLRQAERDPAWPLLLQQYSRATRSDRADGVPEPVDAALAAVALGWAAADLASYAEELVPTTWATTIRLSGGLESLETESWEPHPHCRCAAAGDPST